MGMTITEKILAKASGKQLVKPGEFIWVKVNTLMIHDPCSPGVIGNFYSEMGETAKVWSKENIVVIPDHFIYTTDEKSNRNVELMRKFVDEQKIPNFYDPGTYKYQGVCHLTLSQGGHIRPGEVLIGTDSHTVTGGAFGAFTTGVGNTDASYVMATGEILLKVPQSLKAAFNGEMPEYLSSKDLILKLLGDLTVQGGTYMSIEFTGDTIDNLSVDDRMTICNMAIESGAKNGIMRPNKVTLDYVKKRTDVEFTVFESDTDANYAKDMLYNTSEIEPMVAKPHSPDNCVPARKLKEQLITRAYLGSCTGGKKQDFLDAAKILKGKRVKVETYAVPATKQILNDIITETIDGISIYKILLDSGVKVSTETSCAACCGGPHDTFGRINEKKQICISTTNRNFQGRMGDKDSLIFLASAKTVAASALTGKVTDPRDV